MIAVIRLMIRSNCGVLTYVGYVTDLPTDGGEGKVEQDIHKAKEFEYYEACNHVRGAMLHVAALDRPNMAAFRLDVISAQLPYNITSMLKGKTA